MICWPAGPQCADLESAVTHDDDIPRGGRARLLVVDDSPTALSILRATLEGRHYEVVTASDGREGLEKAQKFSPDLILTDTVMPGMDGFAFLRRLKENAAMRSIPVIMLTSADPPDPERKEQVLPDVFITKTGEFEALLAHIETLLTRPR